MVKMFKSCLNYGEIIDLKLNSRGFPDFPIIYRNPFYIEGFRIIIYRIGFSFISKPFKECYEALKPEIIKDYVLCGIILKVYLDKETLKKEYVYTWVYQNIHNNLQHCEKCLYSPLFKNISFESEKEKDEWMMQYLYEVDKQLGLR